MPVNRWIRPAFSKEKAELLAKEYQLPLFLAEILAARGLDSPMRADDLLNRSVPLSDPFCLPDMEAAVSRIAAARESGEQVAVYGDYDCDGVCAAAILIKYFSFLGMPARPYIPSRQTEGYGLNRAALEQLAEDGVALVITVDNGISAVDEAEYAAELGLSLVITDHHQPGEQLPRAEAVVDAYRADSTPPYRDYCGAGVAYQLVRACSERFADVALPASLKRELTALAALATVGDVVPLTRENRTLVTSGLKLFGTPVSPGLDALLSICGLKRMSAQSIAFGPVPRLNAAGRMGNADLAEALLLCEDASRADELARQVEHLNRKRKEEEDKILSAAAELIREKPELLSHRVLVLWGENWDVGVIGIVCARLLERYGKPVFLLSVNGGIATGSARSMEGFSIHKALTYCAPVLERFGGHAQAGGMTVEASQLQAFADRLEEYAVSYHRVMPRLSFHIDKVLSFREITLQNIALLERLEPFGAGNPSPLFLLEQVEIRAVTPLSGGKHTKLFVASGGSAPLEILCFGKETAGFGYSVGSRVDLLVTLEISRFAGRVSPGVRCVDIRPAGFDEDGWECCNALYEKVRMGEPLDGEEKEKIPLSRALAADVYRLFYRMKGYEGDLDELYCIQFQNRMNYAQYRVILDVFHELGLLNVAFFEGSVKVPVCDTKISLEQSACYRMLCGAES